MLKSDTRQFYVHYIGQSMLPNPASLQEGGELQSLSLEREEKQPFLNSLVWFFFHL